MMNGLGLNDVPRNNNSNCKTSFNKISSYLQHIKNSYSIDVMYKSRLFINSLKKINIAKLHRNFLLTCRTKGIIPNHLYHIHGNLKHLHFYSNFGFKKFTSCKQIFIKKMLKIEIYDINIHIRFLTKKIAKLESFLTKTLIKTFFDEFKSFYQNYIDNIKQKLTKKHDKKIKNILKNSEVNFSFNISVNNADNNNNNNVNDILPNNTQGNELNFYLI